MWEIAYKLPLTFVLCNYLCTEQLHDWCKLVAARPNVFAGCRKPVVNARNPEFPEFS